MVMFPSHIYDLSIPSLQLHRTLGGVVRRAAPRYEGAGHVPLVKRILPYVQEGPPSLGLRNEYWTHCKRSR